MTQTIKKARNPHLVEIRNYTLLTILAAIPFITIIYPYAHLIFPQSDAPLSVFFTLLFITCLYTGRYLAGIWTSGQRPITRRLYIALGTCIVISTVILFVHAQILYPGGSNGIPFNFFVGSAGITLMATCSGILIKVTRYSINRQLNEAKATAAQSVSELQFLQSQLSPHFLFNTLNNLYGISLAQQEKIPALLLKLSDLLRYSVYDAKELYVPLTDEINYIKNYTEFEQLRIGDRLHLDVTIEEIFDSSVKVAPLLLIVFIENAFKHARNTLTDTIHISVMLKTFGRDILFSVSNSYDPNATKTEQRDPIGGLGLENVGKRLELLYAGKYELTTSRDESHYSIKLQLKN